MKKLYLVIHILLTLSWFAQAQQNAPLINVDFKHAGIAQVVTDLQSKTGYHFYYDPVQFDSLRVTLQLTNKTLGDVLTKMFQDSPYHFAISGMQEVVLTKGREIRATLPAGFFDS